MGLKHCATSGLTQNGVVVESARLELKCLVGLKAGTTCDQTDSQQRLGDYIFNMKIPIFPPRVNNGVELGSDGKPRPRIDFKCVGNQDVTATLALRKSAALNSFF